MKRCGRSALEPILDKVVEHFPEASDICEQIGAAVIPRLLSTNPETHARFVQQKIGTGVKGPDMLTRVLALVDSASE